MEKANYTDLLLVKIVGIFKRKNIKIEATKVKSSLKSKQIIPLRDLGYRLYQCLRSTKEMKTEIKIKF